MNAARKILGLAAFALTLQAASPASAIPPGYSYCMKYCSGSYWKCMWNCYLTWCTDPTTPAAWRQGCPYM